MGGCPYMEGLGLTLLELQSHFGDNPLKFQVVCPQIGTAVLNGFKGKERPFGSDVIRPQKPIPTFPDKAVQCFSFVLQEYRLQQCYCQVHEDGTTAVCVSSFALTVWT